MYVGMLVSRVYRPQSDVKFATTIAHNGSDLSMLSHGIAVYRTKHRKSQIGLLQTA